MKLVTKNVAATIEAVPDAKADDSKNGEFVVRLATPGTDREGDDLQGDGWQTPLPDHITFDTDHGMSVKTLAGSGPPVLQADGSIEVKGTYAGTEHGQTTRQLVNEGHIRTVSVTYLERRSKAAGKTSVTRELLNGSFVAVPANPKAVVLASKSLDVDDDEVDLTAQAFHDQAVELGANCEHAGAKSVAPEQGQHVEVAIVCKGISGSVEELGDRVRKAVREQHRSERAYPYVRATFLDDPTKGTVVYELESYGDGLGSASKTLARDFTIDGSKVTLDATPREVSLVTSVVDDQADDQADDGTAAAKSMATDDPTERAIALLCNAGAGMTREAAVKMLGVPDSGAIVATSEGAAAGAPAETVAAAKSAAAAVEAAATGAAAPLDTRARALILQLNAAAD